MATLTGRYATAVHARSLRPDPRSVGADLDVLGAYGLAARQLEEGYIRTGVDAGHDIKPAPLAVPLERLLLGDNKAVHEIVASLSSMAFRQSREKKWRVEISRSQAHDMACACLAWHRLGTCQVCGGHGKPKIPGTPALDDTRHCDACYDPVARVSTGKMPFDRQFRYEWRDLARWLDSEMTRELGRAGERAMATLAKRMDL